MTSDGKTILVCDDDQEILDSVSMALESAGYAVMTAHEDHELTSRLKEASPDLILLDVKMPGRDGFLIAENLQSKGQKAPIIFMSAHDKASYRMYAPFVGAVNYLTKPVDICSLLKNVKKALG